MLGDNIFHEEGNRTFSWEKVPIDTEFETEKIMRKQLSETTKLVN